jgi:hypothetical protein
LEFDPNALADVIKSSGVAFRQNSISYIFACPRCGKNDKLYVRKRDGRFVCWVCRETDGFKGRCEYALLELGVGSLTELREQIYGDKNVTGSVFLDLHLDDWFDQGDEIPSEAQPSFLPVELPPDFYPIGHAFARRGQEYLAGRGITLELARTYDLHYCPPQRRVVFPVKSDGRWIGWQARTIEAETHWWSEEANRYFEIPKILSSRSLQDKRDRLVMFADRLNGSRHAVVTEGPVDALKAHLCGGNIATMGKAVSKAQVDLLLNSGIERVYLALDPDAASEMSRLVRALSALEVYQIVPPPGYKDLGEATCEQVRQQFLVADRVTSAHVFFYTKVSDQIFRAD